MIKSTTINCFSIDANGVVTDGIDGVTSGIIQNTAKNRLSDPAHYVVEETSWEGYQPNAIGAVLQIETSESNLFITGETTTFSKSFAPVTLISLAPGASIALKDSLEVGAETLWTYSWDGRKLSKRS